MNSYQIPGGDDGYQPLTEASLDVWFAQHVWAKRDDGAGKKVVVVTTTDGRKFGYKGTNHEVETLMQKIREAGST